MNETKASTHSSFDGLSLPREMSWFLRILVFLTVASSCIVIIEPAPCDLLFLVTFTIALLSKHPLPPKRLSPFAYLGLYVFVMANILSSMFSTEFAQAGFYASVTFYLLTLWLLIVKLIGRYGLPLLETIFKAYVVAALITATLGLLARFDLIPFAEVFLTEGDGLRVKGTFKDPNVFGPFLVAAIVPLISNLIAGRKSFFLQATAIVILLLGILFSFSRGAYLNLFFSLAVMFCFQIFILRDSRVTKRLVFILVPGAILCVLIAASLMNQIMLSGFLVERLNRQDYDSERFGAQAQALSISLDHPLGIGPGQWELRNPEIADPHNVYLKVLAENGTLGLFGFVIFLATCLWYNLRGILARGCHADLYIAGFSVIAGILLQSLFVDTLHWRHLFLFLALPLGLFLSEPDEYINMKTAMQEHRRANV